MSDTDRPMQSAGPYVHYCHCGEWGGHGYASAPGVGTRWWCWEHYPHKLVPKTKKAAPSANLEPIQLKARTRDRTRVVCVQWSVSPRTANHIDHPSPSYCPDVAMAIISIASPASLSSGT